MDPTKLAALRDRAWNNIGSVPAAHWKCGYCGRDVGSDRGYQLLQTGQAGPTYYIRMCGSCNAPTLFATDGDYAPGALVGSPVEHLPPEIEALFHEARTAAAAGSHTAAVLVCRKILMHIAVDAGALPNQNFLEYVTYLGSKGFIPPQGQAWVNYIRTRGNEANHEIILMGADDSVGLISLVEMLLRFIYELPKRVPASPGAEAPPAAP
jgi:hypothetical protein